MTDPEHVEIFMRTGTDQVMFTRIYANGYRHSYWLPFWEGCWHALKLIFRGVKVKDVMP